MSDLLKNLRSVVYLNHGKWCREAADRIEKLEAALKKIYEIPVHGHGIKYEHGSVEMAPYWEPREIALAALESMNTEEEGEQLCI